MSCQRKQRRAGSALSGGLLALAAGLKGLEILKRIYLYIHHPWRTAA